MLTAMLTALLTAAVASAAAASKLLPPARSSCGIGQRIGTDAESPG